ncbi:hypothetical protein ACI65C_005801 [Semiaphis heraclei]
MTGRVLLRYMNSRIDSTTENQIFHQLSDHKLLKKRKLRSIWQRTRNPAIKTLLNHQTRLVSDLLHSNREEEWSNFHGSIEPFAQGWSKIYKLNRQLLRKSLPTNSVKDELGNLHYDSEAKANIFATCMENQFAVLPNTSWIKEEKYGTLFASFPIKAHQDPT